MGAFIVDIHTAMWFFNGDAKLSKTAKEIIYDFSNPIYMSIASAWEVAIKLSIGKLDIINNTADFLHDAEINKITILPIKPAYLTALIRGSLAAAM